MRSNTHSHQPVVEYKEEEEEKTFNAKTNHIYNSNVIMEMEPPHHSNQRESLIHPRKSSEEGTSLSWSHEEEKLEPNVQSIGLSCEDDIANCKAIKRIIHLLEFYKLHQHALLNNEESVIPLFEHLSSVNDYGIPMFMEDWYQCKKKHFKTPSDIRYFQSIDSINCDNESCVYARRYQRDRSRSPHQDPHQEIDYKNIILMDELNSIHTFIFHWMPSRFKSIETSSLNRALERIPLNAEQEDDSNQRIDNDEEEEDEKELKNEVHLWPNGPKPMLQCNVEEMAFLLKYEIVDKVTKLKPHKDTIIKYVKD
eukprot:787395_1